MKEKKTTLKDNSDEICEKSASESNNDCSSENKSRNRVFLAQGYHKRFKRSSILDSNKILQSQRNFLVSPTFNDFKFSSLYLDNKNKPKDLLFTSVEKRHTIKIASVCSVENNMENLKISEPNLFRLSRTSIKVDERSSPKFNL